MLPPSQEISACQSIPYSLPSVSLRCSWSLLRCCSGETCRPGRSNWPTRPPPSVAPSDRAEPSGRDHLQDERGPTGGESLTNPNSLDLRQEVGRRRAL